MYNFLVSFLNEKDIIKISSDELIRVEYISKSKEMMSEQIYELTQILNAQHKIILLSPTSLFKYYPKKELFVNSMINLKVNSTFNMDKIVNYLIESGYYRVNKIDQSLQFARRGDILDIYSINYENPIRIEFFDDTIESIRFFDIGTQLSIKKLDEIQLLPASIYLLNQEDKDEIFRKIEESFNKQINKLGDIEKQTLLAEKDDLINDVNLSFLSYKNYKYYGYLSNSTSSLLDYFDNYSILVEDEEGFNKSKQLNFNEANKFMIELFDAGKSFGNATYYNERLDIYKKANSVYFTNSFSIHNDSFSIKVREPVLETSREKNLLLIIKAYLELGYKIVCLTGSPVNQNKIKEVAKYLEVEYKETNDYSLSEENIIISSKSCYKGFEFSGEKVVILTERELFGTKKNNSMYSSRFKEGIVLGSYLELEKGDYVVHEYKGIGQFLEITTLLIDGKHQDYIKIAYAGGDIIYVPLYQFNLIRKYVGKDGTKPRLTSLNGDSWEKTKKKIKEKINDLTDRLLALYQERNVIEGYVFKQDDYLMDEFSNEFEHELTNDQIKSYQEVAKDMESPHPMDRLLCGDVGFGKTEIAFRAAFKAIISGKQVCFLCPTTLLAKQHFEVATERFKKFGVKICMISRLNSQILNKNNIDLINKGEIDLAIGTHAILSKNVNFKNIGLLIVDEEQRFGVEQKELMKEKWPNIDVLTLSATPIPRTLQSSLIGLKNISTIKTPPKERMPIQTYVIPYDEAVTRDLIKRELAREGQIYYVYNYIDSIYSMASKISSMIPECRIGVIHGRMDREEIDDVMSEFYSGNIDLLLATSIIENGIDVKNANLMLVYDADHFGLAQLYQIKGRVGRGDRMAFAYLMVKQNKELNDQAKERLKSIEEFTELGSGYKISQRDLLIRGAGDILGPQQAGFIDEVGVDMYIKLLNESIEERKHGKKQKIEIENKFNLNNLDGYIPSEYANDQSKIEIYQKILDIKTINGLDVFKSELKDIYGTIPNSLLLLLVKREIDIHLSNKEIYEEFKEISNFVNITLTRNFSDINGIGTSLFTALLSYIGQIKISYKDRHIVVQVFKKDNWLLLLINVMKTIENLYKINMKCENIENEN